MNNKLQNPLQVLQEKSQEAWSGCIEIESPQDFSICWNVYLLEGKIQYINSVVGQQIRLNYLWQKFNLGASCPQLKFQQESSEYVQLCEALTQQQLSSSEIKKFLFRFVREGLVNVLSINQAKIKFVPKRRIKKALISFTLDQLSAKLEGQISSWKQINSYIVSPFSRLYLDQKNALKFYKNWKSKYNSPELKPIAKYHKLSSFVSLFVAKSCLYQIAAKAKVDIHFIAKLLKQSVTEDLIAIFPFKDLTTEEIAQKQELLEGNLKAKPTPLSGNSTLENNNNLSSLIVCIDDSKTVQKQVRMTLEAVGYRVLGIIDPTIALKKLAQHQPAVIFLDINMPNINGYDLCSLLRKSQKFKDVPIVMLTGRDGMIDRVRAKIVGATDYLTKPCDPNKLITLAKVLEQSTVTV
ncbi:MAG: response regulator [Cyanobacteria bacterium P01_G01_bin.67]